MPSKPLDKTQLRRKKDIQIYRKQAASVIPYPRYEDGWVDERIKKEYLETAVKHIGAINDAKFGAYGRSDMYYALCLSIIFEDGTTSKWEFYDLRDIYEFLYREKVRNIEQLIGNPIVLYTPERAHIIFGVNVPDNLIIDKRKEV